MSIERHGSAMKYLLDYHSGKIKPGLGIGCELDDYLRLKKSSMTIALGHDNVGKTIWLIWMLTCHIVINKKKVIVWSGENQKGPWPRQEYPLHQSTGAVPGMVTKSLAVMNEEMTIRLCFAGCFSGKELNPQVQFA